MRIAFVIEVFPALSETFILNQITRLLDLGHEVDVFASGRRNEPNVHSDVNKYNLLSRTYYSGMPASKPWRVIKALALFATHAATDPIAIVESLDFFRYRRDALSLRMFYGLLPFLGKGSYDIIHCHFGPMGIVGALLKTLGVGHKLVVTFHAYDVTVTLAHRGRHVYDGLFQTADLLMPISRHWKKRLTELGCPPEKTVVHRMGVDMQRFRFAPRSHRNGEPISLLTVGRLVEKKGIEYGIRAVAMVSERHPEWSIRYNIVGGGPLRRRLEAMAEELGMHTQVSFLGPKTHEAVRDLMMQAHIFLLPSVTAENGDQEGIPVVLMEAMAVGLPVLSTLHSGIPELVLDGQSGFLLPERDVDTLAERLEHLIEHPNLWPEMGWTGRKFVEEHYDIRKLNRRLVEIYEALLKGKNLDTCIAPKVRV